jgi:hypothetical protein
VSELLSKPKPWDKLTEKGRDSYRKMHGWASDENAVMLLKSLIPKKGEYRFVSSSTLSLSLFLSPFLIRIYSYIYIYIYIYVCVCVCTLHVCFHFLFFFFFFFYFNRFVRLVDAPLRNVRHDEGRRIGLTSHEGPRRRTRHRNYTHAGTSSRQSRDKFRFLPLFPPSAISRALRRGTRASTIFTRRTREDRHVSRSV